MMTNKRRTHWMVRGLGIGLLGGFGATALPLFAGGPYPMPGPDPRCNKCPDGICVPNRLTYGYYQPKWRRWPGAGAGPEVVPTPAQKEPDEEEKKPADEGPAATDGDERPETTDRDRTPSTRPKSDVPRSDRTGPTGSDLPGRPQTLPAPTIDEDLNKILEDDGPQSPPADMPLMPDTDTDTNPSTPDPGVQGIPADDDPFKDDAPQSFRQPHRENRQASAARPIDATLGGRRKATKVHWRGETQNSAESPSDAALNDSAVRPAMAIEHQRTGDGSANPLRSQAAAESHQHVVPSVWSGESKTPTATSAVWRTNPLR